MDEQEIRLLVRQAIARHLGPATSSPSAGGPPAAASPWPSPAPAVLAATPPGLHPAAVQFVIVRPPGETDCIIEPAVTCNHCGYCLCYGH